MTPKAFISYSWTSEEFKRQILYWCERLCQDGINIVLDRWELGEGEDKYAFMERMVTDASVNKVLIFSDLKYQEKADLKTGGVGTETQIISDDLYRKVSQNKFIPIVCEYDSKGMPCLAVFLRNRIYIDFSSPEKVNEEWEKLLRAIYDKPLLKKPEIGKTPSYILNPEHRKIPTQSKFEAFKLALINDKPILEITRLDYVKALKSRLDQFRITERPDNDQTLDEKVLEYLEEMKVYRDQMIEYFFLNISAYPNDKRLWDHICSLFNNLLEYKFRPNNLTTYSKEWFDNYGFFLHELTLYFVAVSLSLNSFDILSYYFTYPFILPDTARIRNEAITNFEIFYDYSESLREWNNRQPNKYYSPEGEWLSRRATNSRIAFEQIKEAEYLLFLRSVLHEHFHVRWYPHTFAYQRYGTVFPFIAKSTRRSFFPNLCKVLGVSDKDELARKFKEANGKENFTNWNSINGSNLISALNLENLDSL